MMIDGWCFKFVLCAESTKGDNNIWQTSHIMRRDATTDLKYIQILSTGMWVNTTQDKWTQLKLHLLRAMCNYFCACAIYKTFRSSVVKKTVSKYFISFWKLLFHFTFNNICSFPADQCTSSLWSDTYVHILLSPSPKLLQPCHPETVETMDHILISLCFSAVTFDWVSASFWFTTASFCLNFAFYVEQPHNDCA